MFPFIPYRRISINTSISLQQVRDKIAQAVTSEQPRFMLPMKEKKPFFGTVSENGFQVYRRFIGMNSFVPLLRGKFVATEAGVRIDVRMTLQPIVIVFVVAWISLVGLLNLAFSIPEWLATGNLKFDEQALVMLLFVYLLVFFGFGIEAIVAEVRMRKLFGPSDKA